MRYFTFTAMTEHGGQCTMDLKSETFPNRERLFKKVQSYAGDIPTNYIHLVFALEFKSKEDYDNFTREEDE